VRTRVGYAGGTTPNPTYRNLGDHTETLQIGFDPTRITYQDLLDVFWSAHSPTAPTRSQQYASLILYHDERQRRLAEESLAREEARLGTRLYTEIRPAGAFHLAEGYHQKCYLRSVPALAAEYMAIYPDLRDLTDSTAVARVNGYIGGHGSVEDVEAIVDRLGLCEAGWRILLDIVKGMRRG